MCLAGGACSVITEKRGANPEDSRSSVCCWQGSKWALLAGELGAAKREEQRKPTVGQADRAAGHSDVCILWTWARADLTSGSWSLLFPLNSARYVELIPAL